MLATKLLERVVAAAQKLWERLAYFERWLVVGALVGVFAGFFATLFYWLLGAVTEAFALLLGVPNGYGGDFSLVASRVEFPLRLALPLIVAAGAFAGGLLVYRFAPEAEGHGTDAIIMAFHRRAGLVDPQVPFVKAVASALTIGAGGSGGVEGPSAQMGGGLGSLIARVLRYGVFDRRIAVVAGMAAALSAIFRAPIGTALFAVEVLYRRDLEVPALVPAIVASVVAYTVTAPLWGYMEVFPRISLRPELLYNVESLLLYMGLGVFVAPFALVYVTAFTRASEGFARLEKLLPLRALKPMLGAVLAGALGIAVPYALGSGRKLLVNFLSNPTTILPSEAGEAVALVLAIAAAKMAATSFSIGSGGSGGVFAPSITIGALLGYAYGVLVSNYSPLPPIVYAYLGMASFFAAASKTPLATSVMVAEMSGSYHLLVPALIASVVARELTGNVSIYESQLHHRPRPEVVSLEMLVDHVALLPDAHRIKARDLADTRYEPLTLNDSVSKALELMLHRHQHIIPVVDRSGRFLGVVDSTLLGLLLELPRMRTLASVPLRKPPVVHVEDDLTFVAEQLVNYDIEYAVVTDSDGRYYGVVTVADVAAAALNILASIQQERARRRRAVQH